jgi:multicomponent Na+:H+ antiporter subunit G
MSAALGIFTVLCVGLGAFFFFAGAVALLRFPDSLSRLHALTKADNLGLGFVVLGLIPRAATPLAALKLVVLWALVQIGSATVAQMVGGALRRDAIE